MSFFIGPAISIWLSQTVSLTFELSSADWFTMQKVLFGWPSSLKLVKLTFEISSADWFTVLRELPGWPFFSDQAWLSAHHMTSKMDLREGTTHHSICAMFLTHSLETVPRGVFRTLIVRNKALVWSHWPAGVWDLYSEMSGWASGADACLVKTHLVQPSYHISSLETCSHSWDPDTLPMSSQTQILNLHHTEGRHTNGINNGLDKINIC